tara:strand:+ start:513 stop:899 length:387 start_codon:yes stop_codon:yes gene_type:complete
METRKVCIILVSILVILSSLLFKELADSDRILSCLYSEKSNIKGAGRGIFTRKAINKGKYLFTTIIKRKVTPAGAMINHCNRPNTKQYQNGDKWYLYAEKDIRAGDEILMNYNNAPSFIKSPNPKWKC